MEMNDIRAKLLELLTAIAPDVEAQTVEPQRPFRDQFDFDSMDALHFATGVSEAFHIDIPERDYASLASLDDAAQFVSNRMAAKAS